MGRLSKTGFAFLVVAIVALELTALGQWRGWFRPTFDPVVFAARMEEQARQLAPVPSLAKSRPPPAALVRVSRPEDRYYDRLRSSIRWVPTKLGASRSLPSPDLRSRVLLAKSAAERARLHEVGLGFEDVYGIINAETSWIPRQGASKDGTPNLGIAQFEPATARALGLRDPHDLVESVHVAAVHMKEAAQWSSARIARLKLSASQREARLREGVSVYYNLSSRGRAAWNGSNTQRLPRETRQHIANARIGALQAAVLEARLHPERQASAGPG